MVFKDRKRSGLGYNVAVILRSLSHHIPVTGQGDGVPLRVQSLGEGDRPDDMGQSHSLADEQNALAFEHMLTVVSLHFCLNHAPQVTNAPNNQRAPDTEST